MADTIDPSEHSQFEDFTSLPKKKPKKTKKAVTNTLAKALPETKNAASVLTSIASMADKYNAAFMIVYHSKPLWRQKEIDRTLMSGKLSDESWDNDFVQEVIRLAEKE